MPTVTTADLKLALGIPVGLTYHDARLAVCASTANRYVLRRVNQASLAVLTQTEYLNALRDGQERVVLDRWPVTGIVAVTNDTAAVAASAYRVETATGMLYRTDGAYWTRSPSALVVHYGAGYDASTVPDDLVEAALVIGTALFQRAQAAGYETQDDGQTSLKVLQRDIPPFVKAILAGYVDRL